MTATFNLSRSHQLIPSLVLEYKVVSYLTPRTYYVHGNTSRASLLVFQPLYGAQANLSPSNPSRILRDDRAMTTSPRDLFPGTA